MPKFITYPGMSGYLPTYLPTFRHQPMRSQLASQPANEEPALFVNIFFLEICQYIFFENLSIYIFRKLSIYGKFLKIFLILFLETSPYLANFKDLSDLVKLSSQPPVWILGSQSIDSSMAVLEYLCMVRCRCRCHTGPLGLPSKIKFCEPIVNQLS